MSSPAPPPNSGAPPLNTTLMAVTGAAVAELAPLWNLNPSEIGTALMDVMPALVDKWGLAAASAAADWYDEIRDVQGVPGRFMAIVPPLNTLGPEALAGWAAQPLATPPATDEAPRGAAVVDLASAQNRAEGGLQKRLANAANLTVTGSANQDPNARGYMRRTRPGACDFCIMVASRGAVYTKTSATFACHEHCYCEAVPAWGGQPLPVGPYTPADRPNTAKDRARVRKWIKDNL